MTVRGSFKKLYTYMNLKKRDFRLSYTQLIIKNYQKKKKKIQVSVCSQLSILFIYLFK